MGESRLSFVFMHPVYIKPDPETMGREGDGVLKPWMAKQFRFHTTPAPPTQAFTLTSPPTALQHRSKSGNTCTQQRSLRGPASHCGVAATDTHTGATPSFQTKSLSCHSTFSHWWGNTSTIHGRVRNRDLKALLPKWVLPCTWMCKNICRGPSARAFQVPPDQVTAAVFPFPMPGMEELKIKPLSRSRSV